MKSRYRYILGLAGVISSVVGITLAIPSLLKNEYLAASISGVLIVGGLVLLAVALGD